MTRRARFVVIRLLATLGAHSLARRVEARYFRAIIEEGRALASEREDLIAAGVNPASLIVPILPEPLYDFGPD